MSPSVVGDGDVSYPTGCVCENDLAHGKRAVMLAAGRTESKGEALITQGARAVTGSGPCLQPEF